MNHKPIIIILSIIIPVVVAILYVTPKVSGFEIDFLPLLNAIVNGTVFFTLIFAVKAIKNGNRALHQKLIYLALILSTIPSSRSPTHCQSLLNCISGLLLLVKAYGINAIQFAPSSSIGLNVVEFMCVFGASKLIPFISNTSLS